MLITTYKELAASIKSEATAYQYKGALRRYLQYRHQESLDELLKSSSNIKIIESDIIAYLVFMRSQKTSWNHRSGQISAIKHFYRMNDIQLNWYKISKYLGEHTRVVKDRAYTTEEIQQILTKADERMRVVILLLASTGMRIGAIPNLKLSDLKKIDNFSLYQIAVYSNSEEEYYCFCTPEAADSIDSYLLYRQRYGEKLTPNSPLIREMFNTHDPLKSRYPRPISLYAISENIQNLLLRAGINTEVKQTESSQRGRERKEIARCHGFRKFATTNMIRSKVNPEAREMLLGHSIGLSDSYYRPDANEILEEYIKAADLLTINEENRLKRKVQQLTIRSDKLDELHDEVKHLRARSERFDEFLAQTEELQKTIDEVNIKLFGRPKKTG
jgi:integrase